MSGCNYPTLTQADVAALGDIERTISKARDGAIASLDKASFSRDERRGARPQLLTIGGGRHVPNRARWTATVTLFCSVTMFAFRHRFEVIRLADRRMGNAAEQRSMDAGRDARTGIRPRRITKDGSVVVRGRR